MNLYGLQRIAFMAYLLQEINTKSNILIM